MTKQTGLDEMWNWLSEREKVHFEIKYLIDLCECARKDGWREGAIKELETQLELYEASLKFHQSEEKSTWYEKGIIEHLKLTIAYNKKRLKDLRGGKE